jgi:hypothetical protein
MTAVFVPLLCRFFLPLHDFILVFSLLFFLLYVSFNFLFAEINASHEAVFFPTVCCPLLSAMSQRVLSFVEGCFSQLPRSLACRVSLDEGQFSCFPKNI